MPDLRDERSKHRLDFSSSFGPLGVVATFAAALLWSWGTWPDPLVDFGRQLYLAWRLADGDVLYRDHAHLHGPLSVYANASLFAVFGTSLRTLVLANIVVAALLVALLYRLLRGMGGPLGAAVAGVVFSALFLAPRFTTIANYNFVTPYSHEVTHGVLLGVAALAALQIDAGRRKGRWMFAIGTALGLLVLTKLEPLLATAGAVAVGLGLGALSPARSERGPLLPALGFLVLGILLPPLVAAVLLATRLEPDEAARDVLTTLRYVFNPEVRNLPFYRQGMGLDAPVANFGRALRGLGAITAFLVPAALVGRWVPPGHARTGLACVAICAVTIACASGLGTGRWFEIGRPLPFVAALAAMVWAVALWRDRDDAARFERARGALVFCVFAGLLMAKLGLNGRLYHYGFALAMPATLLLVVLVLEWVPALVGRAAVVRAAGLSAIAVGLVSYLRVGDAMLENVNVRVGEGNDTFLADQRGRAVNVALAALEGRAGPDATLLVVPEGVMINYLARLRSPTPHVSFMPPEVIVLGEQTMIDALDARAPDFVMLIPKNTSEYGVGGFGSGYALDLWSWLEARYVLLARVGPESLPVYLLAPRR